VCQRRSRARVQPVSPRGGLPLFQS
jgi:hypothetical protein